MTDLLGTEHHRHRFVNTSGKVSDTGSTGGRPVLNTGTGFTQLFNETLYSTASSGLAQNSNNFFGTLNFSMWFKLRLDAGVATIRLWGGDSAAGAPTLEVIGTNLLFKQNGGGGIQASWALVTLENSVTYVGGIAYDRTGTLRASNLKSQAGDDITPTITGSNSLPTDDGIEYGANSAGSSICAWKDAVYIVGTAVSQTDLDDTNDAFLDTPDYDLSVLGETNIYSGVGSTFSSSNINTTSSGASSNFIVSNRIGLYSFNGVTNLPGVSPFYSGFIALGEIISQSPFAFSRKFSNINLVLTTFDKNVLQNRKLNSQPLLVQVDVNPPPVVSIPIPDQEVIEGNVFDFIVPPGTFTDPESEPLVLTAELENGDPLPPWLTFDTILERFFGIPSHTDIGTLNIKVIATDPGLITVSDVFTLGILEDLTLKTRDFNSAQRALMPKGRAWNVDLSIQFKQVIDAISDAAANVKDYFVTVRNSVVPELTQSLELWEEQFLLNSTGLTESERRSALAARWATQGGQSPTYIEGILAQLGLTATVYENFARADPNDFLLGTDAEILVNGEIKFESKAWVNTCGDPTTTCNGDNSVTCGEFDGLITTFKEYAISVDSAKYVHYWIIADPASVLTPLNVPASLEREFKLAMLRVKPVQTRVILNVNYI